MSNHIIEINNISKMFRIHHLAGGYLSLRERLANVYKIKKSNDEEFWAVRDVSFNVGAGESKAIIGRNGSGKSTLLKILSKITPPTRGVIRSRGRMASLLEVGTGFHPELTGTENIFFNGSLLGMTKKEIEKKFDEIVDFSGVEKFLDTPLKHYSSGMQLRLAFSVAAFLESEILVIDEVLAVGDLEFQKKCLDKMQTVTKSGRTILFVSHSMAAVRALCNSVVVLDKGQVKYNGDINEGIDQYMSISTSFEETPGVFNMELHPARKNIKGGVMEVRLMRNGKPNYLFFPGSEFHAEFDYAGLRPDSEVGFRIIIKDSYFQPMLNITNHDLGLRLHSGKNGSGTVSFTLEAIPFYGDGTYYIDFHIGEESKKPMLIENALSFKLEPKDLFGTGKFLDPKLNAVFPGKVAIKMN
ncbi:MAG: polysaccharide ABC transporter ATP-binding protein [Bacteroidota bacterium]|nr:polysaccharide ABC transporter ATP-binding protein [Bacteroidota bacterium]